MPETYVQLCGLPGSGNRLLMRLFQSAGAESDVQHGSAGTHYIREALEKHAGHRRFAVIPVRDWQAEMTSRNRRMDWGEHEAKKPFAVLSVMRVLVELEIPTRMVSFESIFLYPEESKDLLLDWLGLPWVPWPEGDYPRDENAKWRTTRYIAGLPCDRGP